MLQGLLPVIHEIKIRMASVRYEKIRTIARAVTHLRRSYEECGRRPAGDGVGWYDVARRDVARSVYTGACNLGRFGLFKDCVTFKRLNGFLV